MKYKTIIFDWSGTISDDRIPVYEANKRILERFNRPIPSFEEFIERAFASFDDFARDLGITQNSLFLLYEDLYNKVNEEGIRPQLYADAKPSLEILANNSTNLIVLSTHPQTALEKEARIYEVHQHFQSVRGSSTSKVKDMIEICQKAKISPKNVVYLGDTIHDVTASKQADINSAAVCTGYHSREKLQRENPSLGVFNNLTEFVQSIL